MEMGNEMRMETRETRIEDAVWDIRDVLIKLTNELARTNEILSSVSHLMETTMLNMDNANKIQQRNRTDDQTRIRESRF